MGQLISVDRYIYLFFRKPWLNVVFHKKVKKEKTLEKKNYSYSTNTQDYQKKYNILHWYSKIFLKGFIYTLLEVSLMQLFEESQ